MAMITIVYESGDAWASTEAARLLAEERPAGIMADALVVPSADGVSSALRSDAAVSLVLTPSLLAPLRSLVREQQSPTKLLAAWAEPYPEQLDRFYRLYPQADLWLFSDEACWHGTGCLPRSILVPSVTLAACCELAESVLKPQPKRDLSAMVTAFVTTVGASTFDLCCQRLAEQDCTFAVEIIDHVAPMSAAFQQMLDRCRTPYYVQVDEDMVLFPHAVGTLHDRIAALSDDVPMYAADLYDTHLRRTILGVKIFRHAIARCYPFGVDDSFEVDQLLRMAEDGYRYVSEPTSKELARGRTLGLHGVEWTPRSLFERCHKLMRRTIERPERMRFFTEYPAEFLRRFQLDPSAENYFALQGVLAAVLRAEGGPAVTKDFREYDEFPGFQELQAAFAQLKGRR